MLTADGFFSPTGLGPALLLLLSIPVAIGGLIRLFRPVWRFVHRGLETFEQFTGTPATLDRPRVPGVVETLVLTNDRLDAVEQQLNGKGKITPALDRLERTTEELRELATTAAEQARQAKLAATDAHVEAQELSARMHEVNELGIVQRGILDKTISETADRMIEEMDRRTIAGFRLLAEHGGPDLTVHVTPHTHDVSAPVEPPEDADDAP